MYAAVIASPDDTVLGQTKRTRKGQPRQVDAQSATALFGDAARRLTTGAP
jgi:hypothetical protein